MKFRIMQATIVSIFLTALLVPFAGATNYYIEETQETQEMMGKPARKSMIKTWLTPTSIRREDEGAWTTTIVDLKERKITLINHKDRNFMILDKSALRNLFKMSILMMGGKTDKKGNLVFPKDVYKETGNKKRIRGWDCWEIQMNIKAPIKMKVNMWCTDQIEIDPQVYIDMSKNLMGITGSSYDEMYEGLKGFPVRTEKTVNMGGMDLVTITTVDRIVKDAEVEEIEKIPADYTKVAAPTTFSPPSETSEEETKQK